MLGMGIGYLKMLSIYLIVTFFIIALYIELSEYWLSIGGGSPNVFKIEVPFVLTIMTITYFSKVKNRVIKYVFPVIPILVSYSLFDIFYSFSGRGPRLSDLQNFHSLFDFSPGMAFGLILVASFIPLSICFLIYHAYKEYSSLHLRFSLFIKLSALFAIIFLMSTDAFLDQYTTFFNYITWSENKTIRENGRFSNFIFYAYKEQQNLLKLKGYQSSDIDIHNALYPGSIDKTRNVHIVVLESFIDPRLLQDIQFNTSPLANELKPYLINKGGGFSHVMSSVHGGDTAQSEFEILTGLKAFRKLDSIEFNAMKGGEISGFISRLKQYDYGAIATIATGYSYFNSKTAYKSLGFNDVTFLDKTNFTKNKGDKYIFDGDVLEYNLKKVKRILKKGNKPIFNYVLGMYGHHPYDRNESDRPSVIKTKHEDNRLLRISNQFYYRTKALAKYLKKLSIIDPSSIIYITSDHLPPLIEEGINYKFDSNINISLLLNEGTPIEVSGKKYYEIPWLIWDILSETERERVFKNGDMENLYFKALSESVSTM